MTTEDPDKRGQRGRHSSVGEDPVVEPHLDRALREQVPAKARPEFRAQLRKRFLGLGQADSESKEGAAFGAGVWAFSEESGEPVTLEPIRANSRSEMNIESLLQSWQPGEPRVSFRDALRDQFVSGQFRGEQEGDAETTGTHRPPVAASSRTTPRLIVDAPERVAGRAPSSARGDRRRTWGVWAGTLGLAAAVLVMAFLGSDFGSASDAPGWRVLPPASGAVAAFQVDGQPYASPQDLVAAEVVTAGSEALRLEFSDQMVVEMGPGSALDLTGMSGEENWTLAMVGERGSFRVATLPAFKEQSSRLFFTTPEVEVEVIGTVFGVDRCQDDPLGPVATCVCCTDGEVEVRALTSGKHGRVKSGNSSLVKEEIGSMSHMGLDPVHRGPLEVLGREFH